jgi:hypothetical protein
MSEAARLRAQMAYSTDPNYLERMALDEEVRSVPVMDKEAESTLAAHSTHQESKL